ncbi:AMP-binding protein [Aquincola sp. MAHUQ-54]|uniref:AMP-binding protein n=1 Tax=Aquincola agrisoli TaxID=3119538 RepID=A0AAW9QBM3_9BURK
MADAFDPWQSAAIAADVVAAGASPQALAQRRASRLATLLRAARRRSPLCREMLAPYGDLAGVALQDLPVMRKPQLMARFDDWVGDRALSLPALRRFVADRTRIAQPFLGRYTVWESSGSSGEPGLFVQDPQAMAVYDALEAWRRPLVRPLLRLVDPLYLGERIAFVGAIDGHFATTVSLQRLRRLNPAWGAVLRFVSFLQATPALVAALDAYRPTIVATYPSAAVMLAQEHRVGRLRHAPAEVWMGGETLTPAMRRFVTETFGCAVVNSYGASEFLALASECSHGSLHLNSDWAILEPVDGAGRPVPAGETGSTALLTNLANHVQPLIRYDLGDRVTLRPQGCACGSARPVVEVEGRCDDTLYVPAAQGGRVSILPLAVCTVLEEAAGLFDFQLVQVRPGRLVLSTAQPGRTGDDALQRARASLAAFLSAQGAPHVQIACRHAGPDVRGRSGKVQRVVSLVAPHRAATP